LRHLESVGFPAPRLVRDDGAVEVLTWIDGESGPAGWARIVPETGLRSWARSLRSYHEAVAGFRPPPDSAWSSRTGGCQPGEIVCHGDFGPWNTVWRGTSIAGLIDFDHARPAPPLFDLAYALEYAAPFRDDEECMRWLRYPAAPDRARRIELLCDAYGVAVPDDVAGLVARQQRTVLSTCEDLARRGIEPQATWIREGYLDVLRNRVRWAESLKL
jgi:aminoglycoside phosphotransferase (APT) family kinase protein